MSLPQDTTTIEDLVQSGKTVSVKYHNFSFLEEVSNGTLIAMRNIVWDYIDELLNASISVKLSDDEFQKYKFKPKLLCFDMYGNTEVDFVIMALNNIADVTEFSSQTLRMLRVNDMNNLLSLIYNAELSNLETFNSTITG